AKNGTSRLRQITTSLPPVRRRGHHGAVGRGSQTVARSLRSAAAQTADPLVNRDNIGLTGEQLPDEHPVYLFVGVETAVGPNGEPVVLVGCLAQRGEHHTTGG